VKTRKQVKAEKPEFEDLIILRLYVAGETPKSLAAIASQLDAIILRFEVVLQPTQQRRVIFDDQDRRTMPQAMASFPRVVGSNAAGREIVKVLPQPGWLSTDTLPRCDVAMN